jgi:hypothetical protein
MGSGGALEANGTVTPGMEGISGGKDKVRAGTASPATTTEIDRYIIGLVDLQRK